MSNPPSGQKLAQGAEGRLRVPDAPVVPCIEGERTGPDIWAASVRVLDVAVAKATGGTGLDRGRGADREGHLGEHCERDRHLRLRAAAGGATKLECSEFGDAIIADME